LKFEGIFELSTRPMRRWRDFASRSTRTEVIGFWLLVGIVRYCLGVAALTLLDLAGVLILDWFLALLLLVPTAALFVRRLHDSGRSALWLLLLLPGVVQSAWRQASWLAGGSLFQDKSWWDAAGGLLGLAFLVLIFWTDDPEPNRYGPNPRYDEVPGDDQLA
jgi:uncharacterized membrane protein YhaH (DUF805 family)